jgi:ribosomally synthesized peptide (two-chain TOMM family)
MSASATGGKQAAQDHTSGARNSRSIDGDLMSFRTTWLRAVALAWSDAGFAEELERNPLRALLERFKFVWPWPKVIDFAVNVEQGLKWAGDDWVWPSNQEDCLTLHLPISKRPEEMRVVALADYYAQRPSIFGTAGGGGATPRSQSLITSAGLDITDADGLPLSNFLLSGAPVRFGGNNPPQGGFTPSSGSFADFEVVLLSALAKSWNNQAFAELIQSDKNLLVALHTIRGYTSPWRLILKLKDDDMANWNATAQTWTHLTPHLLTLNLPDRPIAVNEQSVALAAYNSTGAMYPFTCCA